MHPRAHPIERGAHGGGFGLRAVAAGDDDRVLRGPHAAVQGRAADGLAEARRQVEPLDVAALRFGVDHRRFVGVLCRVEAVATAHVEPVAVLDRSRAAQPAGATPGAVVLQPAAHPVRLPVVEAHRVELTGGDVIHEVEGDRAVPAHGEAAVARDHQVLGVGRVDPHRVPVGVDAPSRETRRLAAVVGIAERRAHPVNAIGALRVDADLRVVEGARVAQVPELERPRRAAVGRPIQAARRLRALGRIGLLAGRERVRGGVGFDHRIDDLAVRRRNRDANAALGGSGEAAPGDFGPGGAAVGTLPERGTRAAGGEKVRPAHPLPAGGPEDVGVHRVHRDVDEARLVGDELEARPALAAVDGLVEAAVGIGVPGRAQGGDPGDVGIGRVHDDPADVLRGLEPHQGP